MPMYYPDLQSVKVVAESMAQNKPPYKGTIPSADVDLPKARFELAKYFREVWHDEIAALEVEMAATEENYHGVLLAGLSRRRYGG